MKNKRFLRNGFSLLILILLTQQHLIAQTTIITGRIKNQKDDSAIQGATVKLKNGKSATVSDTNGYFQLNATSSTKNIIIISFVGFRSQELAVKDGQTIQVSLEEEASALNEVVITALGIKKEKKKLGYALQEVKGEDLVKAREPNILGNLTGKVAGLRVANSADFFATPDIKLRGVTPLIVLNGIPLEGTSMWEISGDDVETYSILKGPAASALYGSRGVNGAIQITTKKGTGAGKGTSFEFNSTTTFDLGTIAQPKVQHEYGTGYGGIYKQGDPTYEYWGAWGPKLDGRMLAQYNSPVNPDGSKQPIPWIDRGKNNLANFLRTGILTTDNISFSSSNEKGDFRASLSQMYQKGVVPNTKLGGTTFNMSGGLNLNKRLRFDASINYNRLYTPNYPNIGYGRGSFIYGLILWTGENVDVRDLRNYWVPGKEGLQQRNYEDANDYNNPYFVAYEQTNGYYKDAIFGTASLKYKLMDNLNITARTGVNNYALYKPTVYPKSYNYPRTGNYSETWYNMFEANTDLLADYSKKFGSFDISATLGGNIRNWSERNIFGSTDGLNIPNFDNFSNSTNQNTPTNYKRELVEYGTYSSVDVGYKNYLFLGLTGRYDQSSTLPLNHSGYFYPSASLATILSAYISLPKAITYAKLRAAVTKVGAGMTPYSSNNAYTPGIRWNDNSTLTYPATIISSNIKPSFSTGTEFGGEFRFLKNRAGLDVTYYDFVDGPQTYLQTISSTSGFSSVLTNGRKTERKGWEVIAYATPISTKDFKWNVSLNWSTYRQYLKALAPGVTNEGLITVGKRLDMIQGSGFMYAPDGQLIIGSDGIPQRDQIKKNLGNYGDDWMGGITNTLTYKQFALSFSFDARIGGKIISTYERYLWAGGRHLGITVKDREDLYAGKSYTAKGVKVISGDLQRDGNGNVISDTRKFAPNDIPTDYFNYIQYTLGYYGVDEAAIISRSYVKLRELIFTYKFPQTILSKTFIKQATVSFVGRNLLLITKSGVIDPDQFTGASDNLQTPAFRNIGINFNVNF
jgi:TonB-linked SusC/RagA family outer membrane protein